MAECTDPKNENVSGAFPARNTESIGGLEVNLDANGADILNPNLALSAVQTYNTFNNVANKMFGIEARWFRAVPQQRSKDVIFQEYTLSCVEDEPLCLKVVVPDGNFPESNYQFDLMGLEYNIPTEIQIDKRYWEEIAGFGTAPQRKDIVYLPLPNKLFQVVSSFLKRGFMEQETTWVVNLEKYQPEASRKEGDALKETIDKYTVSEESLFGEQIDANVEKLTDKKQMSPLSSTSEDKYKELDSKLVVLHNNLDIYGIIAAESVYDMNTSAGFNAVTYKNSTDIISSSEDRALMAWVYPRKTTTEYNAYFMGNMPNLGLPPPANAKIKISGARRLGIGENITLRRSKAQNLYAKVVDDNHSASGIYYCKVDQAVLDHLNTVQSQWWTKTGWKAVLEEPITLIDGVNETTTGFVVTFNANQYIKINYGLQEHIAVLDEVSDYNKWYGFVVNIGNTWDQYNVHMWGIHPTDPDIKLQSLFYETLPFTTEETTVDEYTVDKSYSYMTNIRLFDSTIEEERQIPELLSYFTQNADKGLILDNADPRLKAPYISQQR